MDAATFLAVLRKLRRHPGPAGPAPHKPLMLLYALVQLRQHGRHRIGYRDADRVVGSLLARNASAGTRARVADPFLRLETDGIWQVELADRVEVLDGGGNGRPAILARLDPQAGFSDPILALLRHCPALVDEAINQLLDDNFPQDGHSAIITALGTDGAAG
ncbi:hypothetical protein M0638_09965 [Roseomonas sp. NAR14]|uniref:ScoMcrA-like DNA sulfur-binding domain-containing protein n=2 Tax=Roseomonas acroporae TaxID=2937791 RepID=A0A9X2BV49_9PROT|nr:hypothetical protein [Roseomonas acroporae]